MGADSLKRRTSAAAALLALAASLAYGTAGAVRQEAKLTASDAVSGDHLGVSLAAAGDTVVVGTTDRNSDQGAVYVFRRTGTTWTQEALLTPAGPADLYFGSSAAIAGDTLVVGARGGPTERGSAFVFTRTGTTWTQQAKLTAVGGATGDAFGVSVAISGDTAVVGANQVGTTVGAAYVFTRTGTAWTQQARLTASDAANGDALGGAVAVSGDIVIAGAYGVGDLEGAAYVFTRTGTAWTQEAKLEPPVSADTAMFGRAVALEGSTAVIGSPGTDRYRGSVVVFTRTGTTWAEEATLTPADPSANDYFGSSVAVEGDTFVAGAHFKFVSEGVVYVFRRAGTTWTQSSRLSAGDPAASDFFGFAVGLAGDVVAASAFGNDGGRGAAYAFDVSAAVSAPSGYCLPAKVKTKVDSKRSSSSTLTASGTLDTGTATPDFSGPATFEAGGFRVVVPEFVAKGRSLRHAEEGITLTITPSKVGSSRATFNVKFTGELDEEISFDGPLSFCFSNAAHTLTGTAKLTAGALGRNAVTAPGLSVLEAAAKLKGGGRDTISLTLGFPGDGVVPPAAEDLTLAFGGTFTSTLSGGWVRKGSTWVRTARAPGVTKAVVDYAKGTITLAGRGLDLGAFAPGGNAVTVTVTRGADTRSVGIRMSRAGPKLAY